jgi:hypothetical protein
VNQGSEAGEELETLASVNPGGGTNESSMVPNALAETRSCSAIIVIGNGVSRNELTRVRKKRIDFGVDKSRDVLDVIGFVGLEQQRRIGPVNRKSMVLEIVRITGRHDAIESKPTGIAMIGMEPVSLPWVVRENNSGLERANPVGHLITDMKGGLELAIGVSEHDDFARGTQPPCCFHLLASS